MKMQGAWTLMVFSACVAAVKSRPYDIIVKLYCSGPQGSWSVYVCCLHLKMEFRLCARGCQWCGIIHYYWWTASIKPRLLFSRACYASWELFLSSVQFSSKDYRVRVADVFHIVDCIFYNKVTANVIPEDDISLECPRVILPCYLVFSSFVC